MSPRKTLIVFLMLGSGVYVAYKALFAVGLGLGLWHAAPAQGHARPPRTDFGPYPLRLEPPSPDGELEWYNPAKRVERVQKANVAYRVLAQKTLRELDGDTPKAALKLLELADEPDAAQAVMAAMRDLAPQGSEVLAREERGQVEQAAKAAAEEGGEASSNNGAKVKAREPLLVMPQGQPGIRVVAALAEKLNQRMALGEARRFDQMLWADAIRLMGYYGAPEVPEAQQKQLVDGSGKAAPIDPLVRGVLRRLFKEGEASQALASRALGQLGDLETAKDLIEHPRKFKSASISDFGPKAVALFKAKQVEVLKQRRAESESEFWQGARLSYRDRETAIDLAMKGHGGAALAMQRHLALEASNADEDTRMANYLDVLMRFPGTREAFKAQAAVSADSRGLGNLSDDPKGNPKTMEMVLRAMDRDLKIIFGDHPWSASDLILGGGGYSLISYHHMREYAPGTYARNGFDKQHLALEALFRKYYRSQVKLPDRKWYDADFDAVRIVKNLSIYARHVGLEPIQWPDKIGYIASEKKTRNADDQLGTRSIGIRKTAIEFVQLGRGDSEDRAGDEYLCVALRHLKNVWDY